MPSWSFNCACSDWDNQLVYPSSGLPYIPYSAYITLSTLALAVLFSSVYFEYGYERKTDRVILLHVFTALLLVKSLEVFIGIVTLCMGTRMPVVSFSPVEAFTVLLVERVYTSKIRYLALSLPSFAYLIVMVVFGLCSYVVLGFLIFHPDSKESNQYFNTFTNGLWNMFMVFTASNWPNPMMPAYDENRLYFIYFFVFILIFRWGLLNVLLGFVYTLFSQQKNRIVDKLDSVKRQNIELAFFTLDTNKRDYLTYGEIIRMLEVLFEKYEHGNMQPSHAELNNLVLQLNKSNQWEEDVVRLENFMFILEKCSAHALRIYRSKTHLDRVFSQSLSLSVFKSFSFTNLKSGLSNTAHNDASVDHISEAELRIKSSDIPIMDRYSAKTRFPVLERTSFDRDSEDLTRKQNQSLSKYDPDKKLSFNMNLLRSSPDMISYMKNLSLALDTVYYDVMMDTIFLLMGSIYITVGYQLHEILIAFLLVEFVECLSKLLVKGCYRYRKSYRNYFDGTHLICLLIATAIAFSFRPQLENNDDQEHGARYFNSVRVIILIRVLIYFPRNILLLESFKAFRKKFRVAFESALVKAGHFYFLLVVLLVFMYAFAAIGVHAFGGKISFQEPASSELASTPYAAGGYYPLNFNDLPSGIATLYVLLHVNNMHVTISGFTATTSDWAELFFTIWYILGVLFLLNIVVAFFLNEFIDSLQERVERSRRESLSSDSNNKYRAAIINRSLTIDQHVNRSTDNPMLDSHQYIADINQVEGRARAALSSDDILPLVAVNTSRPVSVVRKHVKSPRKSLYDTMKAQTDANSDSLTGSLFADSLIRRNLQEKIEQIYLGSKYGSDGPRLDPIFESRPSDLADSRQNSTDLAAGARLSEQIVLESQTFVPFTGMSSSRDSDLQSVSISVNTDGKDNSFPSDVNSTTIKGFEKAAIYLQLAINGHDMNIRSSRTALHAFRYYSKYYRLIRFIVFLLAFLRYFERPAWTYSESAWHDQTIYPTSKISHLSLDASLTMNILCLAIILAFLILEVVFLDIGGASSSSAMSASSSRLYNCWQNFLPKAPFRFESLSRYLLILYAAVQILLNLCYLGRISGLESATVISVSILNEIYLLWFHRRSFDKILLYFKLAPRLGVLLALLFLVILFFSTFGKRRILHPVRALLTCTFN
jgi:hypothetical protein